MWQIESDRAAADVVGLRTGEQAIDDSRAIAFSRGRAYSGSRLGGQFTVAEVEEWKERFLAGAEKTVAAPTGETRSASGKRPSRS